MEKKLTQRIPMEKIEGLIGALSNDFNLNPSQSKKIRRQSNELGSKDFHNLVVWDYTSKDNFRLFAQLRYSFDDDIQIITLSFPEGNLFDKNNLIEPFSGVLYQSSQGKFDFNFQRKSRKDIISDSQKEILDHYFSYLL